MGSMCFQDMDCTQSGTIEAFQDTSLGCIIATSNFFIIVGLNYFRLSVSYHSESFFREGDAETLVLTSCVLGLFEGSCYYYLLWRADQFIDTLARAALGAIRDNDDSTVRRVQSQSWSQSPYCRIPEVARFPMAGGQGGCGDHWPRW